MQHLSEKQLRNLTIPQLSEIRREIITCISSLNEEFKETGSKADYIRKRNLEKYLLKVMTVLQHKINTGQK